MSIYRRTLAYYRPFLGETLLALGFGLVVTGLNLLKPWPFKYIVDGILSPATAGTAATRAQLAQWFGSAADPANMILFLCLILVVITVLVKTLFMSTMPTFIWAKAGVAAKEQRATTTERVTSSCFIME